jgi:hypothetical protein
VKKRQEKIPQNESVKKQKNRHPIRGDYRELYAGLDKIFSRKTKKEKTE